MSEIRPARRWYHWYAPGDSLEERKLILKLDLLILPYAFILYWVKYMDHHYLLSLLLQATLLIMVSLLFWAPDHIGRRPMLLLGSVTMFVTMFVTMYITAGISGHDATNIGDTRKTVAVAMLFIWAIAYACTWQTLGFIVPAEIPTTKLRFKTAGLAYFFQQAGGLIITFISPYMQDAAYGNMVPYIGLFFGSFSFLGMIFVYFCYPETKSASIEELDLFFEQKLPTRDFGKARRGQHGIQEFLIQGEGDEKDPESGNA